MKERLDRLGLRALQSVAKILGISIERKNRARLRSCIRKRLSFVLFPEGGMTMSRKQIGCVTAIALFAVIATLGVGYLIWGVYISITPVRSASKPAPEAAAEASADKADVEDAKEPVAVEESLSAPTLHHGDDQPPEQGWGSHDIGVHNDQIGLVFGVHIKWPKGGLDAGGGGCNLVILTPGWYEDLAILDGRFEVYDVPMSDYDGWVSVLGQERADEQAANYGCPAKEFGDIPQWESSTPSPP